MRNVRKFYDCSTAHIPRDTATAIEAGTFEKPATMANEYGWLFSVPEIYGELADMGVTCPYFLRIMALAIDAQCDYLLMDCDAAPVEYLESFDW